MCLRFLQVAWSFARTGELPRHDPTHVEGVQDDVPLVGEALAEGEQRERREGPDGGARP